MKNVTKETTWTTIESHMHYLILDKYLLDIKHTQNALTGVTYSN